MGVLFSNSMYRRYGAPRAAARRIRRQFAELAVLLVLAAEIAGLAALYAVPAARAAAAPAFRSIITPSLLAAAAPAPGPATAPARTASVPTCSRGTYNRPAAPAVSPAQPGLQTNLTPAAQYAVYGDTAAQINGQMAACSPVNTAEGEFDASTDYAMAWAYNYQPGAGGLCSLSSISVGLTVSEVYPAWQQTAGTAPGTAADWQRFITSLQTHESGHAQLDRAAATGLLSDLQNFPPTDCGSIAAAANAKAQADLTALNQANDNYDAATNHGATQGAVLR